MAAYDDQGNYDQPYPTAAPRQTGPITDPNDPRLSDPSYASDPSVQAFLSGIYGQGGTAFQPPQGTPGWDPNAQAWNPARPVDPTTGGGGAPPPAGPAAPPASGAPPASPGTVAAPPSTGGIPTYTPPPAYTPAVPKFSYGAFSDPSADDILNDKGYQFERDQGLSAIGANRAAAGTLNTGGTLKDYVGFASNLASTHYNDFWNRKKSTYDTNRAGAFNDWKANYGVGKDVYDENYGTQYRDPFAFNMEGAQLGQQNAQFNASLGQNNNQFNSTLDFNKWLESYKRSTLDPFEQRYRTLSLLQS